jgi:hypothetical protein
MVRPVLFEITITATRAIFARLDMLGLQFVSPPTPTAGGFMSVSAVAGVDQLQKILAVGATVELNQVVAESVGAASKAVDRIPATPRDGNLAVCLGEPSASPTL